MLQQCKLRVMGGKQKSPSRMHLGAEIEWVKWVYLVVKCAIEVPNREIVVSHLRRDNIPYPMFRNVCEVPNGTTAGSKKVGII